MENLRAGIKPALLLIFLKILTIIIFLEVRSEE
jgi:hypothetical protein